MADYSNLGKEDKMITLLYVRKVLKTEKEYHKPRCHPGMHKFDYVTSNKVLVKLREFEKLSGQKLEDFLIKEGRKLKLEGPFIVKRAIGGPGGYMHSPEYIEKMKILHGYQYLKGRGGMPEVCRIEIS